MTPQQATPAARVRIDKWLWAARFYKTRALAVQALDAGQVRVDGERVKPARALHVGARVSVRKGGLTVEVDVLELSDRRGSATVAAQLYRETEDSAAAREEAQVQRRANAQAGVVSSGRPTKRERRKLEDFLNEA